MWFKKSCNKSDVDLLNRKYSKYKKATLHELCEQGLNDVVVWLIENGANIDAKDNYGWTPIHFACTSIHKINHYSLSLTKFWQHLNCGVFLHKKIRRKKMLESLRLFVVARLLTF